MYKEWRARISARAMLLMRARRGITMLLLKLCSRVAKIHTNHSSLSPLVPWFVLLVVLRPRQHSQRARARRVCAVPSSSQHIL